MVKEKREYDTVQYDSDSDNAMIIPKEDDKFNFVMEPSGDEYIELDKPFPGEPPFMKKGSFPALLRFHKFKASVEPQDYCFAEALLYTPFRSEEELEEHVEKAVEDGYISLSEQIQAVKSQVMEHLESTEEARYMVQEALNNNDDVGAEMDAAESEQEEETDENTSSS